MNIYKSGLWQYLAAPMLEDGPQVLTIKSVVSEPMKDHKNRDIEKPVVYFSDHHLGLVLNKTNATVLADEYGPDTNKWNKKPVELYATEVSAFGKTGKAIRVRIPVSNSKPDVKRANRLARIDELRDEYEAITGEVLEIGQAVLNGSIADLENYGKQLRADVEALKVGTPLMFAEDEQPTSNYTMETA